ncbi:MAG: thioredoxin family protein [Verrucomicrobiota bacterium]|nr:thioredoxin family protein [Verrucomicrobiota bacterium]MDP7178826.1 thioredoxin family protein [Verrucomicrobiota bacterium]MDP7292004.1 thioredoxin family protein [Verrucomicrobiota bacterium]
MKSLQHTTRNVLLAVGTAAILSLPTAQADEGWVVDFEKAKAQAAKEGKSILMEFTGSDWCPPCKALHKNVLIKDVFKTEMPKSFVLLKLDSPRDKSKQTPEEIEQYKVLSAKYGVKGVPTIFLADAKGRPYYETVGYSGDPADKYVANLKEQIATLAKRDAAFAKAEKASGAEKAKLLADGLSLVNDEMALKTYGDVVSQIIELDADNKAGLKAKFEGLKNSVGFKAELEAATRGSRDKPEETLAAIDKLIAEKEPTGEALQEAVFSKSAILFQTDKAKAKELLLEAQKLAPESETGKRIDGILEQFFKDE